MDGRPSESVQIYLTQMSHTPLMSRQEELAAAHRVEETRKHLRQAMLATDYVLQAAVAIMAKVARGQMRLEVACEGPLAAEPQKRHLRGVVGPNVATLQNLLRRNRTDFATAVSKRASPEHRRVAGTRRPQWTDARPNRFRSI